MKTHHYTGKTVISELERARLAGESEVSPAEDVRGGGLAFQPGQPHPTDGELKLVILCKLADGELSPPNLTLTVEDGIVTVGGNCRSEKDRKLVLSTIGHIDGVREVVDELAIAPGLKSKVEVTRHSRMNSEERNLQFELEERFRLARRGVKGY